MGRTWKGWVMSLSNSVCVITGSAQGLGKAFAVRLLTAGAKVCLSDLKQETGEKTLAELKERFGEDKVCFVACNVTVEQDFKNLFDKAEEFFKVSCIDILVNNAGINTNWGWKKCMEVNIMAVMMDTEIVSSVATKDKPGLKGHIQKLGGMMTPEYVAEGFYRLVTQCSNGSAMAVLKGSPYIIVPDYNKPM